MAGEKRSYDVTKRPKESIARLSIIVIGSFMFYFCSWGLPQAFGILYIELRNHFGGTKAETAWVQSLYGGVLLGFGPLTGLILKKLGCRVVGIVGSFILFIGLLSSVFTPTLHVLYVTYGLVGGIGGSLLCTTAGVVVLEHFDKKTSLTVGIAGSGASAGTIVIPLLSNACIDTYGFRGTFLILSGLSLQCLIASLTFSPPVAHQGGIVTKDAQKQALDDNVSGREAAEQHSFYGCRTTFSFINLGYIVFATSWAILALPFFVPFLFLPDFALVHGVSKKEAALIATAMGLGSFLGRGGFGRLGDIKRLETTFIHIVPISLFGTFSLVVCFVQGFASFLVIAILIGMCSGICDGIHPVITKQLVGPGNISVGLGLLYCVMSVTTLLGTPIAGWISEAAGRYEEAFYYCAGLSFLAAVIALYIPYWKNKARTVVGTENKNKELHVYHVFLKANGSAQPATTY